MICGVTLQVLLSAMEQGEVTVAKAGLVAALPARTALLAAANPQGGHYNRAKTLQVTSNAGPLVPWRGRAPHPTTTTTTRV